MNEKSVQSAMTKVGDILRNAREKKQLTYHDVYKFVRIHPRYLQALEENDYTLFSSPVHIKGFLKIYCKLLDLNTDELLAFFRREYDEKKMHKARVIKPLSYPRFLITPASIIALTSLFLIFGFFAYLYYQYRSYAGAPSLVIESPKEDATSREDSVEIAGKTDRDSSLFLNGQKIALKEDGSFSLKIDLLDGLNSLNFLSVNKLGKETKVLRTVILRKDRDSAAVRGSSVVGKVVVEISTEELSSFVTVESDGKKVFDGVMPPLTSSTFEASQSVKLRAKNAGALKIKKNGEDLGYLGKEGEEKELEYS
ncbi:DUF4115 domain-containing protein, partial [candidate division WWE3 bacterium]|nr:DUF4115 domain-containing protein [candidate division WWE3 bacterium]